MHAQRDGGFQECRVVSPAADEVVVHDLANYYEMRKIKRPINIGEFEDRCLRDRYQAIAT
jgi:hypothetical protein